MDDTLLLARLRALRTTPAPKDQAEYDALRLAARRAGRRLVEARIDEGDATLIMGWHQESPLAVDEHGGPPGATENVVLTLAACVRLCWSDPAGPLFPGEATTIDAIRQAVTPLGVLGVTQALNRLRACGYITVHQDRGIVRLGSEIALWRDTDIAALRREYERLPSLEAGET